MFRTAGVILAALLLGHTGLKGQQVQVPDTLQEMRAILNAVRERGASSLAAEFLAQVRGPRSPDVLDAFADSLVEIATAFRPGSSMARQMAATNARIALVGAGRSQEGTPYVGAFDKLVRVFEETAEPGVKGGTLWLFTQLPQQGRVVQFLSDVATGSDPTLASEAIRLLERDMGEVGLNRLRTLYETEAVSDSTAAATLEWFARKHGWERG